MKVSQQQIEQFLYYEADLLDQWKLMEWSELFTDNAHYLIPTTDNPDGDPSKDLFLIYDDRYRITARAERLLKKQAHVEYPHSTTRRIISNVMNQGEENGLIHVKANFVAFRTKREVLTQYVGHYKYKLAVDRDGQLKIQEKKVILDLDSLRPQGKVSIVL